MTVRYVLVNVAMVGLLATAACGGTSTTTTPAGKPSGSSAPYSLYTHCGIDEANVGGRWYRATEPLSDGYGNPPKGWDNPQQKGEVTVVSDTEVVFTDSAGHRVTFVLRPYASGPLQVCA
jgi:hypothetical protein